MNLFLKKYIIQTNVWVALCFTGLFIFFQLGLYEKIVSVWGIVFFGTLAIYNFSRIKSLDEFFHFRSEKRLQILLTYIGLLGALICVLLRGFEFKTFLYLGVLGFVSFCYSLPFSGLGLRAIPFLKLFLIAFVWAGSSIGLLLMVHHDVFHYKLLFLSVFLFVIGITIPFDIRDSSSDEKELKTIPQVIGTKNARILAMLSLVLSAVCFYLEFLTFNYLLISWWLTIIVSLGLAAGSSAKKSDAYYSFWLEGCSLLPLLIYLILNLF
ncbi:MAG TPA: hypothetical protein VKY36_01755 [Moheibacter sp.]|nr:hypothetical protein [Moheibacter sp.]